MTSSDPVKIAILRGRLEQIVDEMDAVLFRSAFNPIIAEAHDASHGIYRAHDGATLVQGTQGLPIFVGAMSFAVKAVIEKSKATGAINEGDTWLFNDPYDGGTHLNDFRLVRPVFHKGKLFCWLASVGHWLDTGGAVPGGFNPIATESLQEGMRIPPVKIFEQGHFNEALLEVILANSRTPALNRGDFYAQLNALDLGESRLSALLDEHGAESVESVMSALVHRSAAMMRTHIKDIPDGVWSFEDHLDNDGVSEAPLTIALDMKIDGASMTLDFSRSSAPCAGPLNIARSTAIACCYVALKHVFTDVPANSGCLEPVEFIIPESTLLAAQAPKPVGGYTETILRMIGVIFGAIGKARPDLSYAAPFGTINALSLSGVTLQGRRWVMFSFFGGGLGAHSKGDGLSHANNPISMATIPPFEILESIYPVMFTQWSLRPDSAGAGQYRGGLGAIYELEVLDENGADVFLLGERGVYAPFGIQGGSDAALNHFEWHTAQGVFSGKLVSKVHGLHVACGERIRLETPGGGGWGNPALRDGKLIERDLRLGYVLDHEGSMQEPQHE